MENNYFFVDGSALLSDIKKYIDKHADLVNEKFDLTSFSDFLFSPRFAKFHGGTYRRAVFYFVERDKRIKELIKIPIFTKSEVITDLEIKYCGKRIILHERSKAWLETKKAPTYIQESLHKSEKGVDTQICCDSLVLLSLNKLDRLFLYSNDYDFIPLCRTIKTMGANISLVRLTDSRVNKDLAQECDSLCAFNDREIYSFFGMQ